MAKLLCAPLLLTTASICPAASEAKTYADCILENMKGINSDVAAQAIKDACAVTVLYYSPLGTPFFNKSFSLFSGLARLRYS